MTDVLVVAVGAEARARLEAVVRGRPGLRLLTEARPTNDTALREALDAALTRPDLAPLARAVAGITEAAR